MYHFRPNDRPAEWGTISNMCGRCEIRERVDRGWEWVEYIQPGDEKRLACSERTIVSGVVVGSVVVVVDVADVVSRGAHIRQFDIVSFGVFVCVCVCLWTRTFGADADEWLYKRVHICACVCVCAEALASLHLHGRQFWVFGTGVVWLGGVWWASGTHTRVMRACYVRLCVFMCGGNSRYAPPISPDELRRMRMSGWARCVCVLRGVGCGQRSDVFW